MQKTYRSQQFNGCQATGGLMTTRKTVTRKQRIQAYHRIVELARGNALILRGVGGVITIVHPDIQEQEGVLDQCLKMSLVTETSEASYDCFTNTNCGQGNCVAHGGHGGDT